MIGTGLFLWIFKMAKHGEGLRFLNSLVGSQIRSCVIWPYGKSGDGYGSFLFKGKYMRTHRAMLIIATGVVGEIACHSTRDICTSRLCVNPNHLRWGTPEENSADTIIDGTRADCEGEENPNAKLSLDDVSKIRKLLGTMYQKQIGNMFGVTKACISDIKVGKTWN